MSLRGMTDDSDKKQMTGILAVLDSSKKATTGSDNNDDGNKNDNNNDENFDKGNC